MALWRDRRVLSATRFFSLIISLSALYETLSQRSAGELLCKGYRLWRRSGWKGISRWFRSLAQYKKWVAKYDVITAEDLQAITEHLERISTTPLITVLMPVYNTPEIWLRRAIESVRAQAYPHWELCISDDASSESHVRAVLHEYAQLDSRIRPIFRPDNGHISAASNTALEHARGDYLALLDHDDELPPHALYMVAVELDKNPHLDLIYSDEDKIDASGQRFGAYFKPDWNPDLFTAQNMVSHLGVYRTEIVRKVGGFRVGYEGSQDWDLALRVSENVPSSHIHHIPHVLYHWRAIRGSTASTIDEKPYAVDASIAVVRSHLERCGLKGEVIRASGSHLRVKYTLPDQMPLVTVIIRVIAGSAALAGRIETLFAVTAYPAVEVLVLARADDPLEDRQLESLGQVRVLRYDPSQGQQAVIDLAVSSANGELLCLMREGVEIVSEDWLTEMVSQACRPDIGVVGPMLCSPDETINSAGMVLGLGGVVGDAYGGEPCTTAGYMGRASLVQNVLAVNGACMVVRKAVYLAASRTDLERAELSVYHDLDFCLRVRELGFHNLWSPFAVVLCHDASSWEIAPEAKELSSDNDETRYMRSRWRGLIENDPAHNPNLSLEHPWPFLADRPRASKPWHSAQ